MEDCLDCTLPALVNLSFFQLILPSIIFNLTSFHSTLEQILVIRIYSIDCGCSYQGSNYGCNCDCD